MTNPHRTDLQSRKKKQKQKSKNSSGKYAQIHKWMTDTAAWRSLSGNAVKAYIAMELCWRGPGSNNGRIAFSVRQCADAIAVSIATAARALGELEEKGFAVATIKGWFARKVRHATEWRLTAHACDVTGELATKDFTRWSPGAGFDGLTGETMEVPDEAPDSLTGETMEGSSEVSENLEYGLTGETTESHGRDNTVSRVRQQGSESCPYGLTGETMEGSLSLTGETRLGLPGLGAAGGRERSEQVDGTGDPGPGRRVIADLDVERPVPGPEGDLPDRPEADGRNLTVKPPAPKQTDLFDPA